MKILENTAALGWLWKVSGRGKWSIALLAGIQAVLGVATVVFAWFLRGAIDGAAAGERETFLRYMALLGLVVAAELALRAVKRFLDEHTRSGLENALKGRLFSTLMGRDYGAVTAVHSGEWMNRLTTDTVVVADGLTTILPDLLGMAVRMVGALGMIMVLAPVFGWVLIPGGLALLGVTSLFRRVLKRMHKDIREADGSLRVFLSDRLSSLIVVRAFAREEAAAAQAEEKMSAHRGARMRRNRFSNLCNIGFGLVMNGIYLAAILYGGWNILQGTLSYGSFTALLQMVNQVQGPFANITAYLPKFYAMTASAERLMEAESLAPAAPEGMLSAKEARAYYQEDFAGLGLAGAAFTYRPTGGEGATSQVLRGLDLHIRKGEYVAFLGPSGSGKSTVLKILMGLYGLDEGTCYLEDRDGTRRPGGPGCTRLFAYVPQGNYLMSGTIRELVTFGDREKMADEAGIRRALAIACAEEFVAELPQGADTVLGERGMGLSEGQMQRIAIARAICSDNPILILDEATSALDEATEGRLLANLRAMTDKTVLIVTHRPAALAVCGRQVVIGAC